MPPRPQTKRVERAQKPKEPSPRKGWGSLARKGAMTIKEDGPGRKSSREEERKLRPPPERDAWKLEPEEGSRSRSKSGRKSSAGEFQLSPQAINEIQDRVGDKQAQRYIRYLRDAARAYASERWGDVRKALRPLRDSVPDAPSVQELYGMLLYRTGRWAQACQELEKSHLQTLSYDLYPVMMDCRRALKQTKKIEALWSELKSASPSPDVLAEGRIVYASFLADRERLQDGIRLLEKAPKPRNSPKIYHLRSWYVLADLYERTGDVGKARIWFERVAHYDPDLADVLERLEFLD